MRFLVENKIVSDIESYDDLLNFNADQITNFLEDFVFELNSKIKPSGVMSMIAAPELFFEMNRKIWHKKLIRKSINKNNTEASGNSPITTAEIKDIIDPVSYRCLICHEILNTPHNLKVHLQIEHKWKQKQDTPRGLDT